MLGGSFDVVNNCRLVDIELVEVVGSWRLMPSGHRIGILEIPDLFVISISPLHNQLLTLVSCGKNIGK